MNDHDLPSRLYAARCQLHLLTLRYPAFRFRHGYVGPRGHRWIAERINGSDPGLHTLITSDICELRAALEEDEVRHAR